MTSAARDRDDPALREGAEASRAAKRDRGGIGTEATRAGILEAAANTGRNISIEKGGNSGAGMENHKTRPRFALHCLLKSLNRISPALWARKAVSRLKAGADS